ncbi:MAG: hypothetical protein WC394_02950, partial [Candidatus Omnitrophota bacterium]
MQVGNRQDIPSSPAGARAQVGSGRLNVRYLVGTSSSPARGQALGKSLSSSVILDIDDFDFRCGARGRTKTVLREAISMEHEWIGHFPPGYINGRNRLRRLVDQFNAIPEDNIQNRKRIAESLTEAGVLNTRIISDGKVPAGARLVLCSVSDEGGQTVLMLANSILDEIAGAAQRYLARSTRSGTLSVGFLGGVLRKLPVDEKNDIDIVWVRKRPWGDYEIEEVNDEPFISGLEANGRLEPYCLDFINPSAVCDAPGGFTLSHIGWMPAVTAQGIITGGQLMPLHPDSVIDLDRCLIRLSSDVHRRTHLTDGLVAKASRFYFEREEAGLDLATLERLSRVHPDYEMLLRPLMDMAVGVGVPKSALKKEYDKFLVDTFAQALWRNSLHGLILRIIDRNRTLTAADVLLAELNRYLFGEQTPLSEENIMRLIATIARVVNHKEIVKLIGLLGEKRVIAQPISLFIAGLILHAFSSLGLPKPVNMAAIFHYLPLSNLAGLEKRASKVYERRILGLLLKHVRQFFTSAFGNTPKVDINTLSYEELRRVIAQCGQQARHKRVRIANAITARREKKPFEDLEDLGSRVLLINQLTMPALLTYLPAEFVFGKVDKPIDIRSVSSLATNETGSSPASNSSSPVSIQEACQRIIGLEVGASRILAQGISGIEDHQGLSFIHYFSFSIYPCSDFEQLLREVDGFIASLEGLMRFLAALRLDDRVAVGPFNAIQDKIISLIEIFKVERRGLIENMAQAHPDYPDITVLPFGKKVLKPGVVTKASARGALIHKLFGSIFIWESQALIFSLLVSGVLLLPTLKFYLACASSISAAVSLYKFYTTKTNSLEPKPGHAPVGLADNRQDISSSPAAYTGGAAQKRFREFFGQENVPLILGFVAKGPDASIEEYSESKIRGSFFTTHRHRLKVGGLPRATFYTKQDSNTKREERLTNQAAEYDLAPKARIIELPGGDEALLTLYAGGRSFGDWLEEGHSSEEACNTIKAIAYSLGRLHAINISHGDLPDDSALRRHVFVLNDADIRFIDFDASDTYFPEDRMREKTRVIGVLISIFIAYYVHVEGIYSLSRIRHIILSSYKEGKRSISERSLRMPNGPASSPALLSEDLGSKDFAEMDDEGLRYQLIRDFILYFCNKLPSLLSCDSDKKLYSFRLKFGLTIERLIKVIPGLNPFLILYGSVYNYFDVSECNLQKIKKEVYRLALELKHPVLNEEIAEGITVEEAFVPLDLRWGARWFSNTIPDKQRYVSVWQSMRISGFSARELEILMSMSEGIKLQIEWPSRCARLREEARMKAVEEAQRKEETACKAFDNAEQNISRANEEAARCLALGDVSAYVDCKIRKLKHLEVAVGIAWDNFICGIEEFLELKSSLFESQVAYESAVTTINGYFSAHNLLSSDISVAVYLLSHVKKAISSQDRELLNELCWELAVFLVEMLPLLNIGGSPRLLGKEDCLLAWFCSLEAVEKFYGSIGQERLREFRKAIPQEVGFFSAPEVMRLFQFYRDRLYRINCLTDIHEFDEIFNYRFRDGNASSPAEKLGNRTVSSPGRVFNPAIVIRAGPGTSGFSSSPIS